MAIDFAPPEHCPPYREKCRCERLSVHTRETVERASRDLYHQAVEEAATTGRTPPDAWFRSRMAAPEGPIMILHEHYAGMGGRSTMGQGVGGFALGASCPLGGLAIVTAVTYDLPWFTKLLNHYVVCIMNTDEDCTLLKCKYPNTFTCWQLNFGKNDSEKLTNTCFYNPHVDKNNATVCSIGTSFGDYEGGGIWIADPKGTTMIKFEQEVEGILPGLVPGTVCTQKTRWLAFWAATNVHAVPPFRKNRIGAVAFASQTALRVLPEERKILAEGLGFMLPLDGDHRFLPRLGPLQQCKDLDKLTAEEMAMRDQQALQYNKELAAHQRSCDKMSIRLAKETAEINRKRVEGMSTERDDGSTILHVQRKLDPKAVECKREMQFMRMVQKIEESFKEISFDVAQLENLARSNSDVRVEARMIYSNLYAEFKTTLTEDAILPESDDDELDPFEEREQTPRGSDIATASGNSICSNSNAESGNDSNTESANGSTSEKGSNGYATSNNEVKRSPVKVADSLPMFPFRKKLTFTRANRKKMENARWKHKLKHGSLDTWKCPQKYVSKPQGNTSHRRMPCAESAPAEAQTQKVAVKKEENAKAEGAEFRPHREAALNGVNNSAAKEAESRARQAKAQARQAACKPHCSEAALDRSAPVLQAESSVNSKVLARQAGCRPHSSEAARSGSATPVLQADASVNSKVLARQAGCRPHSSEAARSGSATAWQAESVATSKVLTREFSCKPHTRQPPAPTRLPIAAATNDPTEEELTIARLTALAAEARSRPHGNYRGRGTFSPAPDSAAGYESSYNAASKYLARSVGCQPHTRDGGATFISSATKALAKKSPRKPYTRSGVTNAYTGATASASGPYSGGAARASSSVSPATPYSRASGASAPYGGGAARASSSVSPATPYTRAGASVPYGGGAARASSSDSPVRPPASMMRSNVSSYGGASPGPSSSVSPGRPHVGVSAAKASSSISPAKQSGTARASPNQSKATSVVSSEAESSATSEEESESVTHSEEESEVSNASTVKLPNKAPKPITDEMPASSNGSSKDTNARLGAQDRRKQSPSETASSAEVSPPQSPHVPTASRGVTRGEKRGPAGAQQPSKRVRTNRESEQSCEGQ